MVGTCQYAGTGRGLDSQICKDCASKISHEASSIVIALVRIRRPRPLRQPVSPCMHRHSAESTHPQMKLQPLYDWIFHQRPDGAALSMKAVGMVLGVALLLLHLWALLRAERAM